MNFSGFVNAAAQLGLQSIVVSPTRGIMGAIADDGTQLPDITAQATVEERHEDHLIATEHPVEQGAPISDHAYKRPAEVVLHLGWSNSPSDDGGLVSSAIGLAAANNSAVRGLANAYNVVSGIQSAISGYGVDQMQAVYQQLLQLQEKRALFVLYTAKRVYVNMICQSISTETDYKSANNLMIRMICRQLILVNSFAASLPASVQREPKITADPINNGTLQLMRIN